MLRVATAVQNFCLGDRRREHGQWLLGSEPTQDYVGRQGLESFRTHVRVEYDHLASFGGRRTASRGGNASSTPPRWSTCRRIDSPRFSRGRTLLALSPALRISRASSSMDLPWLAANRRSFALTVSARRRIVMLAMTAMISLQSILRGCRSSRPSEDDRSLLLFIRRLSYCSVITTPDGV